MKVQMELPAFRELPAERRAEHRALIASRLGRRSGHRKLLVNLLATAVVFLAPTVALRHEIVDFWSAEPAPGPGQLYFGSLHTAEARSKFGDPSITPDGAAREVMRVVLDGESRPLWVVPTKEGSFCYRLHFTLSCLTPENRNGAMRIGGGGLMAGDGVDWVDGPVLDEAVQQLEILYQDGERVKIPFVWVSPPIDAGLYAYDIPREHEQPGHLAVAVIGLDEGGDEIAHHCLPIPPDELARSVTQAASLCERRN